MKEMTDLEEQMVDSNISRCTSSCCIFLKLELRVWIRLERSGLDRTVEFLDKLNREEESGETFVAVLRIETSP